ncbi:MAG: tetratricopeptide repeat protein [Aggregatilineales bacterium]
MLFLIPQAYAQVQSLSLYRLTQEANERYDARDDEEAIALYSQVLEIRPTSADALFGRGLSYLRTRNFELSLNDFQSIIANNSQSMAGRIGSAYAYMNLFEFSLTDEMLTEAENISPEAFDILVARGYFNIRTTKYEAALVNFEQLHDLYPLSPTTSDEIGIGYVLLQSRSPDLIGVDSEEELLDAAEAVFRETVETKPTIADTYIGWGYTLLRQNEVPSALGVFESVLFVNPTSLTVYTGLGYASLRAGNLDRAIEGLNVALASNARSVDAYVGRALTYLRQDGYYVGDTGRFTGDNERKIFSYIMGFYNRKRIHSALDYQSPHQYEQQSVRLSLCLHKRGIGRA